MAETTKIKETARLPWLATKAPVTASSARGLSLQPQPDLAPDSLTAIPSYSATAAETLSTKLLASVATPEANVPTSPAPLSTSGVVTPPSPAIPSIQRLCADCTHTRDEDKATLQPKLTIGQLNDPYEQEADRVAAQIMAMPDPATMQHQPNPLSKESEESDASPPLQAKPLVATITPLVQRQGLPEVQTLVQMKGETCEQESTLQRVATEVPQVQPDLESRLSASQSGGSPLPNEVRSFMEPRFGADFSQVRVHTGESAVQMNREVGAKAFTHGKHLYFGAGYAPGNDELTAHELTHTIQQTGKIEPKLDKTQAQNDFQPIETNPQTVHAEALEETEQNLKQPAVLPYGSYFNSQKYGSISSPKQSLSAPESILRIQSSNGTELRKKPNKLFVKVKRDAFEDLSGQPSLQLTPVAQPPLKQQQQASPEAAQSTEISQSPEASSSASPAATAGDRPPTSVGIEQASLSLPASSSPSASQGSAAVAPSGTQEAPTQSSTGEVRHAPAEGGSVGGGTGVAPTVATQPSAALAQSVSTNGVEHQNDQSGTMEGTVPPIHSASGGGGVPEFSVTPDGLSPEYAALVQELAAHHTELLAAADQHKAQITTAAQQQKQSAQQLIETEALRVEGTYDQVIGSIQSTTETQRQAIYAALDAARARVNTTADAELTRLQEAIATKQTAVWQKGSEKAQKSNELGTQEAQRAQTGSTERGQRAQQIGNEKVAQYQSGEKGAEIASSIRNEVPNLVSKFVQMGNDVAGAVRSKASDMAGHFEKEAGEISAEFSKSQGDAHQQINENRNKTLESLQKMADESTTKLSQQATDLVSKLSTDKAVKSAQIRNLAPGITTSIDGSVTDAITKVDTQTTSAAQELNQFADRVKEGGWYAPFVQEARADLLASLSVHQNEQQTFVNQLIGSFGQVTSTAQSEVRTQAETIVSAVETIGNDFQTNAAKLADDTKGKMQEAAAQGEESMKLVTTEVETKLQEAVDKADGEWEKQLSEKGSEITGQVNQALTQEDSALNRLSSDIDARASRAANASVLDAIVDFVVGVFEGLALAAWDLLKGIWEAIKTPLFWIVVAIVVVVLVIAVIVLVIKGAAVLAAIAAVLAFAGKVLLVIGVFAGVIATGYYLYLMVSQPNLTARERGRLLGRAFLEIIMAFAGTGILKRLGVFAQLGRLRQLVARVGGIGRAIRLINKVPNLEKLFLLLDKVGDAEKLLQLLDKVKDAEKLIELLDTIKDVDTALKLVQTINKAEDVLKLWRAIGNADDILRLWNEIKNADNIIKLWNEIKNIDDIIKLWKEFKNVDDIITVWKLVGNVEDIFKLLTLKDMTPSLLGKILKAKNMTIDRLQALMRMPEMTAPRLRNLLDRFGDDAARLENTLKTTTDNAADLEKLLQHMTPAEIEQFAIDIADATKFKELASKYGGNVLKHYGSRFFKDFKGVDADTMKHLLNFDGIDKKKGIKGCHDDAMFLDELLNRPPDGVSSPPAGVGRGQITNTTPHPADSTVKKYEYGFWQQDGKGKLVNPLTLKAARYEKTTMQGLIGDAAKWQASAMEAVEDAIRNMQFPPGDGSFQGVTSSGLRWEGWYRGGKIDTVYILF